MCGRYVASSSAGDIARYFAAQGVPEELLDGDAPGNRANFNVAPTTDVLVVYQAEGLRRLDRFRWGLVPRWAKDLRIGNKMINARGETVATKNAYRAAFRRRRCLVPADGFFEWVKHVDTKTKTPMYIHRPDDEPFAFAGLWETWKPPHEEADGGEPPDLVHSCTIITTRANDAMAPVHDRMPVMLAPDRWERWLDPENDETDRLQALLVPAPDELIAMHPVSTEVNSVRNSGPHLIDRVEPVEPDLQTSIPFDGIPLGESP